ncbi:hypothetical protein FKM82_029717 [Ascaphus truei]
MKTLSLWGQRKVFFIGISLSLWPWRGKGCRLSLFLLDRHGRGEWVPASIESGSLHGSRWHNAQSGQGQVQINIIEWWAMQSV